LVAVVGDDGYSGVVCLPHYQLVRGGASLLCFAFFLSLIIIIIAHQPRWCGLTFESVSTPANKPL